VTWAADGKTAVEKAEQEKFDLVLMDVQMPGLDGYEATHIIRENEVKSSGHVPILAMTAHAMKGDEQKCLDAGMDGYVAKPVRSEELYHSIAIVFNGKHDDSSGTQVPLNFKKALRAVDGDPDLLKIIADDCVEEFPGRLEEINKVVEERDAEGIERKVHGLKSNIGLLGAESAFAIADQLETMARQNQLEESKAVFGMLREEIRHICNFLADSQWMSLCKMEQCPG